MVGSTIKNEETKMAGGGIIEEGQNVSGRLKARRLSLRGRGDGADLESNTLARPETTKEVVRGEEEMSQ